MEIKLTQAELIVAVDYYFNKVKFKDPVMVISVKDSKNVTSTLHVEVSTDLSVTTE